MRQEMHRDLWPVGLDSSLAAATKRTCHQMLSGNTHEGDYFCGPSKRVAANLHDVDFPCSDPTSQQTADLWRSAVSVPALPSPAKGSIAMDLDWTNVPLPELGSIDGIFSNEIGSGWFFEDSIGSSVGVADVSPGTQPTDKEAHACDGEAVPHIIDLTLSDSEGTGATVAPSECLDKDNASASTHGFTNTWLSTPVGETCKTTPGHSDDRDSKPDFDTCFGHIHLRHYVIRESVQKEGKPREFYLNESGDFVIMYDTGSKEYAGYLDQATAHLVITLLNSYNTELSVTFRPPHSLLATIYGHHHRGGEIGDLLTEKGYFLQQPHTFNQATRYYNPQYLVRPGSEFRASWSKNGDDSVQISRLNKRDKSQVSQVLDSACGPTLFSEVRVSDKLKTELLPHQKKALAMMVEKESGRITGCEFPTLWTEDTENGNRGMTIYRNTVTGNAQLREPTKCRGGLLADDMGLGKTLSTLALIGGSVNETQSSGAEIVKTTLIVTTVSALVIWENQIEEHFREGSMSYVVYHGQNRSKDPTLLDKHSIILTTYGTVRADFKEKSNLGGTLCRILWHRLVLDEAHMINNASSQSFEAVHNLSARHRWCVTATPIQNRVQDLGALVKFLRVSPFDDTSYFRQTFTNRIEHNYGWEQLRTLVQAISLRRTKKILEDTLPPREEIIQPVQLNLEERKMYQLFIKSCISAIDTRGSARSCFQGILRLRQICNHGPDLLPTGTRQWLDSVMPLAGEPAPMIQTCENCDGVMTDSESDTNGLLACFHQVCQRCIRAGRESDGTGEVTCPVCNESEVGKEEDKVPSNTSSETPYNPSSKVRALLDNLQKAKNQPIRSGGKPVKSVVFTSWSKMLDLVEKALRGAGFEFQRIDGSKNRSVRKKALRIFSESPTCTVLIATLGSAGAGIDLTAASQVHILEPVWNPMVERQAIDRVYRIGQTEHTLAIRYIVDGANSIEKYVRRRQEWKTNLASASLSDSTHGQALAVKDMFKDLRNTLSQS